MTSAETDVFYLTQQTPRPSALFPALPFPLRRSPSPPCSLPKKPRLPSAFAARKSKATSHRGLRDAAASPLLATMETAGRAGLTHQLAMAASRLRAQACPLSCDWRDGRKQEPIRTGGGQRGVSRSDRYPSEGVEAPQGVGVWEFLLRVWPWFGLCVLSL